MGAVFIMDTREGTSADAAWDKLYRDSIRVYGDDAYNGSFSTCSFRGVRETLGDSATSKKISEARKFAWHERDNVYKGIAYAVDCGITEYVVVSVRAKRAKGRPKTKFVVVVPHEEVQERVFDSLEDAKKGASVAALRYGFSEIQKRSVYSDGNFSVQQYERVEKKYKTRPKRVPKGASVEARHLYLFYGMAAE